MGWIFSFFATKQCDFNQEDDFLQTIDYCSGYPIIKVQLVEKFGKKVMQGFPRMSKKTKKNKKLAEISGLRIFENSKIKGA